MIRIIPFIIFCLSTICSAELRTWTAVNGNKVEANYISSSKGIVKLRLKSGKLFEVPKNKLSKDDNEFIDSLFKKEVVVGSGVRKNLSRAVNGDKLEKPLAETKSVEEIPLNPNLKYEIQNGTVTITGCDKKASGALTITATVEGKPVTSIGSLAFILCTSLTRITIPDSVTSIGHQAFAGCRALTSITIPDSVTSIGNQAFSDCEELTSVTIGDSVTSIGRKAFWSCTSLKSITIPDGVTSIREMTFGGCTSLTSVTIPDSVTTIGHQAFISCTRLTAVTFLGDAPKGRYSLSLPQVFKNSVPTIYRKPETNGWGDTFAGRPVKLSKEDNEFINSLAKLDGINGELLEERNEIFYLKDSDTPYTGKTFSLYNNGQKMSEGNFKNGKPDGLNRGWHENGKQSIESNWNNGTLNGLQVAWHKNGQKMSEGNIKDGKQDGVLMFWHENGQKIREENYKDGKGDGLQRRWHENGQTAVEANFKDGLQNGLAVSWYKNGQTAVEVNFKDGEIEEGSEKYWNSKGEPVDSEGKKLKQNTP